MVYLSSCIFFKISEKKTRKLIYIVYIEPREFEIFQSY